MPISASLKKMLILSGINFDKKKDLFDQAKKSLKKFKSDIATGHNVSGSTAAGNLEPAFVTTTQEEALATSANLNQSGYSWFHSRGYSGSLNFKGRHDYPLSTSFSASCDCGRFCIVAWTAVLTWKVKNKDEATRSSFFCVAQL